MVGNDKNAELVVVLRVGCCALVQIPFILLLTKRFAFHQLRSRCIAAEGLARVTTQPTSYIIDRWCSMLGGYCSVCYYILLLER